MSAQLYALALILPIALAVDFFPYGNETTSDTPLRGDTDGGSLDDSSDIYKNLHIKLADREPTKIFVSLVRIYTFYLNLNHH